MDTTHTRTVNGGTPELITTRAALDEINAGMMDKAVKRTIRQMSAARGEADIEYRDGRKVVIRHATPEQIAKLTPEPAMPKGAGGWAEPCNRRDRARFAALPADRKRTVLARSAELYDGTRAVTHTFTIALDEDEKRHTTADSTGEATSAYGWAARIVTVKGKRYVVELRVSPAKTQILSNGTERTWPGGVDYWTERNGKCFGPVRVALGNSRPGTVGAAIWAAANQ